MESSSALDAAQTADSMSKKKILSDEWVAELFSANSVLSDTEHDECYSVSGEESKNANETEKTNCELINTVHQESTETESANYESHALKEQLDCNNKARYVVDRNCYREESDSSSDESDSSSSSADEKSESSDSSLDLTQKTNTPPEKNYEKKNLSSIKTRGELGLEDLPPIEELTISVLEKESEPIGKVHSIVEQLVVVRAIKGLAPVDLDSVLFLSHSRPLGRVFDVFGPVSEPFYSVRFNTVEDIKNKLVEIGMDVFYAPARSDVTKFVFVDQLRAQKGSDASWTHNNEPPEEFLDFSNDEEERSAKKMRQNKKRDRDHDGEDGKASPPEVAIIKDERPSYAERTRYEKPRPVFRRQQFVARPVRPPMGAPRRIGGVLLTPRVAFTTSVPQSPSPFAPYQQRQEHQFGQLSNPALFSPGVALVRPRATPTFIPARPTVFFTPPNFSQPPTVFSPPLLSPRLVGMTPPSVPPPNVPLSIQVPPNYLSSPPPPLTPVFQSPPTMFYNPPPYRFHNGHV